MKFISFSVSVYSWVSVCVGEWMCSGGGGTWGKLIRSKNKGLSSLLQLLLNVYLLPATVAVAVFCRETNSFSPKKYIQVAK